MIPSWPTSLPQTPLLDGFSEQCPNNLLRSTSEAGVVKVRRKGASLPWELSVSFMLTKAQRTTFINFVEDTLMSGVLRFSFSRPIDGGTVEVRIVPSNDGIYSLTKSNQFYSLDLTLEVLP